jgi:hypothetical protein
MIGVIVCLLLTMGQVSWGSEVKRCIHGRELTEELKRAYAQLREIAKGIEGMEVEVKCLHGVNSDWTLNKEGE